MSAPELLPCPFCGSAARLMNGGPGNFFVQCDRCKASTDDRMQHSAIRLWNRRADLAAAQTKAAVREALEEAAGAAYGTVSPSAAACAVFNRVHGMISRLDAEEPKP